ncbi:hypothetical protein HPHPA17_1144 [Helicobacter pylori Hp A-17]|nr:hypothetical protein HPHPA17_1144 [Helicobacter pylori Hp A-17]
MKTYSCNHFLFFCFILGAFLLGLLSPAYALSIITTKEIDANLPNGAIEGRVVLGKRVFKVEAHGFYFRNNATNSIDIEITSLLRDDQSFPLTSSAKTSLKIPPNAKIKKSTILVLKGENAEEVAKILGVSKEEYQKLENIAQTKAANDPMYANTPFLVMALIVPLMITILIALAITLSMAKMVRMGVMAIGQMATMG